MKDLKQVVFEAMKSHKNIINEINERIENPDTTFKEAKGLLEIGDTQSTIISEILLIMLDAGIYEEYKHWENDKT